MNFVLQITLVRATELGCQIVSKDEGKNVFCFKTAINKSFNLYFFKTQIMQKNLTPQGIYYGLYWEHTEFHP